MRSEGGEVDPSTGINPDGPAGAPPTVMPDLIRHPGREQISCLRRKDGGQDENDGGQQENEGAQGNDRIAGSSSAIRGRAGVTLVELVIWLAIVGTVSVIGSRMFHGMRDEFKVRRAVREVAALLEWARWEAIRGGRAVRVAFDSEGGRVDVYREAGGGGDGGDDEPEMLRTLELGKDHPGVRFGAVEGTPRTSGCNMVNADGVHLLNHALRFHPTGTSDRSGSVYLIPQVDLPDRRDRMGALSVLLTTGRVQLWRYDTWAESGCGDWGGWVPLY